MAGPRGMRTCRTGNFNLLEELLHPRRHLPEHAVVDPDVVVDEAVEGLLPGLQSVFHEGNNTGSKLGQLGGQSLVVAELRPRLEQHFHAHGVVLVVLLVKLRTLREEPLVVYEHGMNPFETVHTPVGKMVKVVMRGRVKAG